MFGKETSADGGKVRLRKEEGEGSHWLDYKAVRLHGSYYGAFFLDYQALINYSLFQIYEVHPRNRVSLQFSHHY